jgi:hypothetical protein
VDRFAPKDLPWPKSSIIDTIDNTNNYTDPQKASESYSPRPTAQQIPHHAQDFNLHTASRVFKGMRSVNLQTCYNIRQRPNAMAVKGIQTSSRSSSPRQSLIFFESLLSAPKTQATLEVTLLHFARSHDPWPTRVVGISGTRGYDN